jgi:hypothetical protein
VNCAYKDWYFISNEENEENGQELSNYLETD